MSEVSPVFLSKSFLYIPSNTLSPGQTYTATLTANLAGESLSTSFQIKVSVSPIFAIIAVCGCAHDGWSNPLKYLRRMEIGRLEHVRTLSWMLVARSILIKAVALWYIAGVGRETKRRFHTCRLFKFSQEVNEGDEIIGSCPVDISNEQSARLEFTGQSACNLTVEPNTYYRFNVTVWKQGEPETAGAATSLIVIQEDIPPSASIIGPLIARGKRILGWMSKLMIDYFVVSPSSRFVLLGSASPRPAAGLDPQIIPLLSRLSYSWSLVSGPPFELDASNLRTSPTSKNLVVKPGVLQPGTSYRFRLTVVDGTGKQYLCTFQYIGSDVTFVVGVETSTTYGITTNARPTTGRLRASPMNGTGGSTVFTFSASGFVDPDTPLSLSLEMSRDGGRTFASLVSDFTALSYGVSPQLLFFDAHDKPSARQSFHSVKQSSITMSPFAHA